MRHRKRYLSGPLTALFAVTALAQTSHHARLMLQLGNGIGGRKPVAVSSGGRYVVIVSQHSAQLWEIATGKELRRFNVPFGDLKSAAFSPDMRQVAVVDSSGFGDSGGAHLFNIASGREIACFGKGGWSVAFSPHGDKLVKGEYGGSATVWDISSRRQLLEMNQNDDSIDKTIFSPDGKRIIAVGAHWIRVFDASKGALLRTIRRRGQINSDASISEDGRFLAVSDSALTQVWDLQTALVKHNFRSKNNDDSEASDLSPDGRTLLLLRDRGVEEINLNTGASEKLTRNMRVWGPVRFIPHAEIYFGSADSQHEEVILSRTNGEIVRSLHGNLAPIGTAVLAPRSSNVGNRFASGRNMGAPRPGAPGFGRSMGFWLKQRCSIPPTAAVY